MRANSTPDRIRLAAVVTVIVLVVVGAVAWFLTDRLVNQTVEAAESTGEVLIATQQVSASFAEADASAVSVHLAGAEGNREQRRLFELAMDRATASLEQVARLVGDDEPSHAALRAISARTTEYAGLIESARVASVEDLPWADTRLSEASAVNRTEISPEVQLIAERARDRFDTQTNSTWYFAALLALVAGLVALLAAQIWLGRRFRRLVNIPLVLGTIAVIVLLGFSTRSFVGQQQAFDDAQTEALDAIVASEEIQQTAYRHRALSTTAVLTGEVSDELAELEEALESERGLLAQAFFTSSSPRERAGASTVAARWERYVEANQRSQDSVRLGSIEIAESITQGEANAAFNGFNTSVEAALLDNREEFLGQLNTASNSLVGLRLVILVGSLLAALLAWWGFALRIGEYR